MKVLGLTGSIGMGKSTTAQLFARLGCPVFDADRAVHRLMAAGGPAIGPIAQAFPQVVKDGVIDRAALGKAVFGDALALARLEAILHPLVRAEQSRFLVRQRRRGRKAAVLDIPLLLEKTGWRACDRIVVATAPQFLQAARVLKRPGMDPDRLNRIIAVQMPDAKKRRAADFVVPTGLGKALALRKVKRIVTLLDESTGQKRCAKLYWIRKPPGLTR